MKCGTSLSPIFLSLWLLPSPSCGMTKHHARQDQYLFISVVYLPFERERDGFIAYRLLIPCIENSAGGLPYLCVHISS